MAAPVTFNLQTFGSAPDQYSTEAALEAGVQTFGDKIFDEAIKNSGKSFASRTAAVSAGQDALPSSLGQITTREGDYLVLRSPTATADDPLFSTSPQWGVVSRLPVKGLVDRLGIFTLAAIGGTPDAITATADALPATGMKYLLTPLTSSAGAVTLSINGGAALSLRDAKGNQLSPGALRQGVPHLLVATSSSQARIISPSVANYGGALTAADLNTAVAPGEFVLSGGMINGPAGYSSSSGLLTVSVTGDFVLQTLSTTTDAAKKWERRIRVSTADFRNWVEYRAFGDEVVATLTGADLNTVTTNAKFVLNGGFSNKPADYSETTGLLEVKAFGSFIEQTLRTTMGATSYWWRKIRPSASDYSEWMRYQSGSAITPVDPNMPFAGKTIAFLGDSITENYEWPETLAASLGGTAIKGAFGGTRLTEMTGSLSGQCGVDVADAIASGNWEPMEAAAQARYEDVQSDDNRPIVSALKAVTWAAVDYIVCFWGTNDWSNNVPLGNAGDNNRTTIRGGVNYFMSRVLGAYPHLSILWVTPMFKARISVGDGKDSDSTTDANGIYLWQMGDAISEEVAARWHCPVYDLYRNSGINKTNYVPFLRDQTVDGLHPGGPLGNGRMMERIGAALISAFRPV